jgi:hypothetical protein
MASRPTFWTARSSLKENTVALKIDRLEIPPPLFPANLYLARMNSYEHTPLRSLTRLTKTGEEPVKTGSGVLEISLAGESTEVFILSNKNQEDNGGDDFNFG